MNKSIDTKKRRNGLTVCLISLTWNGSIFHRHDGLVDSRGYPAYEDNRPAIGPLIIHTGDAKSNLRETITRLDTDGDFSRRRVDVKDVDAGQTEAVEVSEGAKRVSECIWDKALTVCGGQSVAW